MIALIFRDFVHKWYAQITSDVGFVEEVVTVIAHVTRALEERLRKVLSLFPHRIVDEVDRFRGCVTG